MVLMVRNFAVQMRPIFTDVAAKADTEYPTLQRRYPVIAKRRRRENTQRQRLGSTGFSLCLRVFVRIFFTGCWRRGGGHEIWFTRRHEEGEKAVKGTVIVTSAICVAQLVLCSPKPCPKFMFNNLVLEVVSLGGHAVLPAIRLQFR